VTADESLKVLKEGNGRFSNDRLRGPNRSAERRMEIAAGQNPLAAVLTCSDSRVVPEILFDRGLGDLFVVRVAGNVADGAVLASVEYSVLHLGVPLVVVLGHTKCGALTAALSGEPQLGSIATLIDLLREATVASRNGPGDPLQESITTNVRLVVDSVSRSLRELSGKSGRGSALVVGAVYDIETGRVGWMDD
jgi:carbonic anhydrase